MTKWDPADHFNNLHALIVGYLKASTKAYLVAVNDEMIQPGRSKQVTKPSINVFTDRGDPSDSNNISIIITVRVTTSSIKRGGDDQEKELNGILSDVIYELNYAHRRITSVTEDWSMVRAIQFDVRHDAGDDRIVFADIDFEYIWTGDVG